MARKKGIGVPLNSVEMSPDKRRTLARRRRKQEARWAARSGPVITYIDESVKHRDKTSDG